MTSRYLYFPDWELKCRCGKCEYGQNDMSATFMSRLVRMRAYSPFSFPLNRAISCTLHDTDVGGNGIHPGGHCVDVRVTNFEQVRWIIGNYEKYKLTGCGIRMHGDWRKRFMHLDDLDDVPGRIRPAFWTYS